MSIAAALEKASIPDKEKRLRIAGRADKEKPAGFA